MNKGGSFVWISFCESCQTFLENGEMSNFVAKLISSLQDIGAEISIKLPLLYNHLDH